MDLKAAISGDVGDIRLIKVSGNFDNLDDVASVRALAQKGSATVELGASVASSAARTIQVELGSPPGGWLSGGPTLGKWTMQLEITFDNGQVLTWPNQDTMNINVLRQIETS